MTAACPCSCCINRAAQLAAGRTDPTDYCSCEDYAAEERCDCLICDLPVTPPAVPDPRVRDQLAEVTATVENSRQTHVRWIDYLRLNPSYEPGLVGDLEHHEQCVREYDNVLAVLGALLAKLRAVEALLPLWNESYEWRNAGGPDVLPYEEHVAQALWVVMDDLRRALDAEATP